MKTSATNQYWIDQIENYLLNRMDLEQRTQFESLIQNHPEWLAELELQAELFDGLKSVGKEWVDQQLKPEQTKKKPNLILATVWIIPLIVALSLLISFNKQETIFAKAEKRNTIDQVSSIKSSQVSFTADEPFEERAKRKHLSLRTTWKILNPYETRLAKEV